eukprot:gb/GECH01009355.1/.p1 GENE.gb/GECH01009355.1/~~gb/GECH01009355.1/.p1  ORF type:complete len:247 (+),score=0.08 gb/GECH01009355.1/:1-741(+)
MPLQPSILYYKRLLNINCFGAASESTALSHVYLYSETAGGKTVNEVGSLILKVPCFDAENLVFYLDNCRHQNKNRYLFAFLSLLVDHKGLNRLRVKYMTSGHTHFAPDCAFGWINMMAKSSEMYNIEELEECVRSCNPLTRVHQVAQNDIKDLKIKIEEKCKGITGISKFAEVCFLCSHPGKFFASNSLLLSSEEPNLNDYPLSGWVWKCSSSPEPPLCSPYYLPQKPTELNNNKKKDLESLFEKI